MCAPLKAELPRSVLEIVLTPGGLLPAVSFPVLSGNQTASSLACISNESTDLLPPFPHTRTDFENALEFLQDVLQIKSLLWERG